MTMKTKKTLQHIAAVAVVLLTLCLVFVAPVAAAETYYVSTDGDDNNAGTANAPFATIQKAMDGAVNGDTIIVKAGSYNVYNSTGEHNLLIEKELTIKGEGTVELYSYQGETRNNLYTVHVKADNVTLENLVIYPVFYDNQKSSDFSVSATRVNEILGKNSLYMYYNQIVMPGKSGANKIGNLTVKDCTLGDLACWEPGRNGAGVYLDGNYLSGAYRVENCTVYGSITITNDVGAAAANQNDLVIKDNRIYGALALNGVRNTGWNEDSLPNFPVVTGNNYYDGIRATFGGKVPEKIRVIAWHSDINADILIDEEELRSLVPEGSLAGDISEQTIFYAEIDYGGIQGSEGYESGQDKYNIIYVADAVALTGDKPYSVFTENENGVFINSAFGEAKAGDTITLLKDVTLTEKILIENGDDLTINGNGKKITGPTDSVVAIQVNGGKLTLGEGLTVFSESGCPLYIRYGDVITSANLITNGVYGAIQGNGNDKGNVTINGGTLTSAGSAIYWPQDGALIINGGTITGKNAVYFKSGSLSITDGTFVGNGVKTEYSYDGNGNVDTGDALAIENVGNTGYEAISSVSVSGGTFTSVNASAVASYAATSENPDAKPVTAFITGGTFSSNPSAYIAPGMEVVQPGDKYLVQKYVDRSSSTSSSTTEPEEPEQPEQPVVEPETPAAPGEVTVETEVTDGGEVELETPAAEGEGGSAAADEDEAKITGVVLPTGTDSEVAFVPVSEQPAPAGQEENTKKVFEINVPSYEKGKAAVIKFTMTVAELAADGKEAADVALWHFDEETGEWTKLVTSYTIVDGVVYFEAITNDFSPFAIIYEDEPVDEPVEEPETPESPAPVLGLLAALGAAVVLRRK